MKKNIIIDKRENKKNKSLHIIYPLTWHRRYILFVWELYYTLGNLKRNKMSVKINKVVMANRTPLDAYHSYEV